MPDFEAQAFVEAVDGELVRDRPFAVLHLLLGRDAEITVVQAARCRLPGLLFRQVVGQFEAPGALLVRLDLGEGESPFLVVFHLDLESEVFPQADDIEPDGFFLLPSGDISDVVLAEEDALVVFCLEGDVIAEQSGRAVEGEGDGAFFGDYLAVGIRHLDLGATVFAGRADGKQGNVLSLDDLDGFGQVRSFDMFSLGRDFLDAGPDDLGIVADPEGVAEFLVQDHLIAAE